jgi:hypothetical protein
VEAEEVIQGRRVGPEDIALVRHWLGTEPGWNRTRLSRELCRQWNWRNEAGQLKDMACRSLLLKLERRGLIGLPARQRPSPNGLRNRQEVEYACDRSPIRGPLSALRPLRIERVGGGHPEQGGFRFLLQRYHYLGLGNTVGENLKYWVEDRHGRPVACLLFGSAAWKAQARDRFIGWDAQARQRGLSRLTNNHRFLIFPWVHVPHLASHILARVTRGLNREWLGKYGHRIEAVETFVERERFAGTCYRAAGWRHVGATAGRSRNDVDNTLRVPIKDIYLLALSPEFRGRLCG